MTDLLIIFFAATMIGTFIIGLIQYDVGYLIITVASTFMLIGLILFSSDDKFNPNIRVLEENSSLNVVSYNESANSAWIECRGNNLIVKFQFDVLEVSDQLQLIYYTSDSDFIVLNKNNVKDYFDLDCLNH